MAKATIAKLVHSTSSAGMEFVTTQGYTFYVKSFDGVVLRLSPGIHTSILEFTEIIAGCFSPRSTFKDVKKVIFTFNGKRISVTRKENLTPEKIYARWNYAPYR
jgi:hypothetical protein